MQLLDFYWNQFLDAFIRLFARWFNEGLPFSDRVQVILKVALTLFILLAIYEIYLFFVHAMRRRRVRSEDLLDGTDNAFYGEKDTQFTQSLEAAKDLEGTVAPLKKAKRYDRIGEIYASVNRPKEAAKWYKKAGDKHRAAMELSKAGLTVQAARLLQKTGDHATAAHFFEEKGKYRQAAAAHAKAGNTVAAAAAYARGGRVGAAANRLRSYFDEGRGTKEEQLSAADQCYALLQEPPICKRLPLEERKHLQCAVARRFADAGRNDLAAQLFAEGGDAARAGDLYTKLGRPEEAARMFKAAGRRTPP